MGECELEIRQDEQSIRQKGVGLVVREEGVDAPHLEGGTAACENRAEEGTGVGATKAQLGVRDIA